MSIREGTGRFRRAGLRIALILSVVNVWLRCRTEIFAHYHPRTFDPGTLKVDPLNLEIVALAIPGALLWPAGWILEGFAKEAG